MASSPRDYYEVLGLARDADPKAIKEAFRSLAMKYHPDRNKEAGAEERFKEIAEAYAVLCDPKKRADYDQHGFAGVAGFSAEDLFGGIDFGDIFGGSDFGFPGAGLFEHFFRPHRQGPQRVANLQIDLLIPLAKVAAGGREELHLKRPASCPACRGSGAEAGTAPRACVDCQGSGRRTISQRRQEGGNQVVIQQIGACPVCQGSGKIIDHPCPRCSGRGQVEQEDSLTLEIPPGVEEAMVLHLPGRGQPSLAPGGLPGDLLVVVHSAPDARFRRDGSDLWHDARIGVLDAVLGAELDVPALDGGVKVTLPPGTQPDATLRLQGKGLPKFGGQQRGDLYVRLLLQVPENLSAEERLLYEKLRRLAAAGP